MNEWMQKGIALTRNGLWPQYTLETGQGLNLEQDTSTQVK